jgi:hypothetical protein
MVTLKIRSFGFYGVALSKIWRFGEF